MTGRRRIQTERVSAARRRYTTHSYRGHKFTVHELFVSSEYTAYILWCDNAMFKDDFQCIFILVFFSNILICSVLCGFYQTLVTDFTLFLALLQMTRCYPQEVESEDDYEVDNEYFVPHGYLSDEEIKDKEEMMVGFQTVYLFHVIGCIIYHVLVTCAAHANCYWTTYESSGGI